MTKKIGKLETTSILISKQAYRWLNEKKTWQYKYERKKVKATIYKEGKYEGIDCILQDAQQETTGSRTIGTSSLKILKWRKHARGHA